MTAKKYCPGHNSFHPISEFGLNSNTPDGYATYCKPWANKLQREWKKANPDKVRDARKKYIENVKKRNLAKRETRT